jgi:hypothetical protein
MTKKKTAIDQDVERGELLRYLSLVYPQAATPRALLHHLDYSGVSVTDGELDFHLRYLAEKGYLDIDEMPHEVGETHRVRTVKITSVGIDLVDHRRAGETGVKF